MQEACDKCNKVWFMFYFFIKCIVRWYENTVRFEKSDGNWLPDEPNSVRFHLTVWDMACMECGVWTLFIILSSHIGCDVWVETYHLHCCQQYSLPFQSTYHGSFLYQENINICNNYVDFLYFQPIFDYHEYSKYILNDCSFTLHSHLKLVGT